MSATDVDDPGKPHEAYHTKLHELINVYFVN